MQPEFAGDETANLFSRAAKGALVPALLLALAVFALYAGSLHNPLVFDDLNALGNGEVFWNYAGALDVKQRLVSYTSFTWNRELFGDDWLWFRLVNVALHLATALAIFGFFSRLFAAIIPDVAGRLSGRRLAFFGALIFAVHPVAVYGVAYLMQRSIVMATLFSVLALWATLEGMERRRWYWFGTAVLAYVLAVLSKEHAAGLPLAALGLALLVHKPSRAQVRRYAWVAIPALALLALAGWFVWSRYHEVFGAVFDENSARYIQLLATQSPVVKEHPLLLSILNEGWLFFRYLFLWLVPWPGWMAIDLRPPFPLSLTSWPQLPGFLLFAVWPLAALWLILKGGRRGLCGFAMLYPWVLFPTELATVWIQDPFVLYRSYLWMAMLPACLPLLTARLPRAAACSILLAFAAFSAWAATDRLDSFRSEFAVWNDAVAKNPNSPGVVGLWRIYNNRGKALYQMGRIDEAIADYNRAEAVDPKRADPLLNRGVALHEHGQAAKAHADLDRAIELGPDLAAPWYNRGVAWLAEGQKAKALDDFTKAVEHLQPRDSLAPLVYTNRGVALVETGRVEDGLADFQKAAEINPRDSKIFENMGISWLRLNKPEQAVENYGKAIALKDSIDSRYGRATAYLKMNKPKEAVADLDAAAAIDPTDVDIHQLRADALAKAGEPQRAIAEYDLLLRLKPEGAATYYMARGHLQLQLHDPRAAAESMRLACGKGNDMACVLAKGLEATSTH